ncbi:MAG TPA: MFS transporter [Vicinamibacterales bacterium]|nr:MFS transporter [Vicinamibacterales bacterium]
MLTQSERRHKIWSVVRVSSGNFLEMYDFFVFAYYASAIGRAFFPSTSEFASLMSSLMTFGVGFLMRPLGAIVLGTYIDKRGRRDGLLLTLSLMAIGTLSIGLTPGYATIGLLAPLLVVSGRLLQGFSAGVELGGVSVYLSEIATPGHKGFYVAWQSGSQQIAVMFVALLGVMLSGVTRPEQMTSWGWRVPFLIGCLIVPFIFQIRRSLPETDEFLARRRRPNGTEVLRTVAANWGLVLTGVMMVTMTTVSFYFITAYTPTFGQQVLKLASIDGLVVTLCVGLSNLVWLIVVGALSDRIGRRPILIAFTTLALLTAYPALSWLVSEPSFGRLLLVELWLSFIYGSYNGAMVVHLTEIMPIEVRTAGFSLAYSLATALFGGFTPAISTYLIHATGDRAMPGVWLSIAAACGLVAALRVTVPRPSMVPVPDAAA